MSEARRFDYLLFKADGTQECLHRSDRPLTLAELQGHVGGYIEFVGVPIGPGDDGKVFELCVNEEGLLHHLPHNTRASQLAGRMIVGDVVLATRATFEAEETTDE